MRMLSYDNGNDTFSSEYVSLVLGEKFLITFQEGLAGDVFGQIRSRLQKSKSKVRNSGVDFLCYLLLDTVVDHYITIIEKTGDKIEALEDDIIAAPAAGVLVTLHSLRNDLLSVKKSVIPLRDYLNRILVESSPVISHETMLYFRDLYNHITHAISTIEGYREITIGIQDLYHSTLSTKMNQVMKVLTIITTIFIPLSFIAGLYGMNFKNMPELEWHFGYYAVLGVMLVSTLGMAAMMKWKKWF
jgi:magnesium transporter